jgi:hypothetical protein
MYKGVEMRGEVGLLTRNIKFDSEDAADSTTYGGHIKVRKRMEILWDQTFLSDVTGCPKTTSILLVYEP